MPAQQTEQPTKSNAQQNGNQVDQSMIEELNQRFELLLTLGKQIETTSPNVDIHQRPDYFDEAAFKKAQKVALKYYINIGMGSGSGLILLLQFDSIAIPLLMTGKSRTVPDLYDRYSQTGQFMKKFYKSDYYDPESEGWRALQLIRAMHQRIYKFMNSEATNKTHKLEPPQVWVNQYDSALTQFAFIGLLIVRPDKCGASKITNEELCDIVYYWRILSYYFGIEDRFNLFAFHDNLQKQLVYLNIFVDHVKKSLGEHRAELGIRMAEGFMLAFSDMLTEASFNTLDHWWSSYLSLSGRKELQPYTMSDRWKVVKFQFSFKVLFKSDFIQKRATKMYMKKFDKFCDNADKIRTKLARKHPDFICQLP